MVTFVLSAIGALLMLCVLILIHEWGHFAAARAMKVTVEEFGFGLPPAARTLFTSKGTRFTLNWIPFGGFVRLKGENALEKAAYTAPGSFAAASIPARMFILCAGVFMNFALAVFILFLGFSFGWWLPSYDTCEEQVAATERGVMQLALTVRVEALVPGGGADNAGVPAGSMVTAVDGQPVRCPADVSALQADKKQVVYTIETEDSTESSTYTVSLIDGKSGIVLAPSVRSYEAPWRPPWEALGYAIREAWMITKQTTVAIANLFVSVLRSFTVPEGVAGIVGIAQLTYASVEQGFVHYLWLLAVLSLSLAALNILPLPALDGGRLVFVLTELITRRRVNRKFELATNGVGFLFLISLILLITYNDIIRLFS